MVWLTLTPVTDRNKAVAVGAVLFHVDHFVTGRIAKFTYGAPSSIFYQPFNPEHVKREKKSYLDVAGDKVIPSHFATMLSRVCHHPLLLILPDNPIALQGTRVLEDQEIRQGFSYTSKGAPRQQAVRSVIRYTGTLRAPEWMDIEPGSVTIFNSFARGI